MSTSPFMFEDDRDMTGARWSSAVICPRKAVFEHMQVPEDEGDDPRAAGWKLRGNLIAQAVRTQIIDMMKAEGRRPQFEVEIPWGIPTVGVGHADIYVPHRHTVVELYTSVGLEIHPRKVLQCAGYVIHHPRAKFGELLIVDPLTGEDRTVPIDAEAHRETVESIVAQVSAGVHDGVIPDRVCKHPADGPTMFCDKVGYCFAGWTETPLERVGREFEQLADELLDLTERRGLAGKEDAANKARVDEIKNLLAEVIPPDGTARAIGPISVQRTHVPGSTKMSMGDIKKAGVQIPEQLEPFVKHTAGYDRWTVKRLV